MNGEEHTNKMNIEQHKNKMNIEQLETEGILTARSSMNTEQLKNRKNLKAWTLFYKQQEKHTVSKQKEWTTVHNRKKYPQSTDWQIMVQIRKLQKISRRT